MICVIRLLAIPFFAGLRKEQTSNHQLLFLSTYLGHVKPSDTYWYLTGAPELLALAAQQFEAFSTGVALGEQR